MVSPCYAGFIDHIVPEENRLMLTLKPTARNTTVYLTRDWERQGIEKQEAEITESGGVIVFAHRGYDENGYYGKLGKDSYENLEDAIARVLDLRQQEILKLEKQIKYLREHPIRCGTEIVYRTVEIEKQWYEFCANNSPFLHGYGTLQEANTYADILNKKREKKLWYTVYELDEEEASSLGLDLNNIKEDAINLQKAISSTS
jgi:hypothetical protein